MTGRVCEKHEQYCPDGVCKWCERLPEVEGAALPQFSINPSAYSLWRAPSGAPGAPWVDFVSVQQAMNAVWGQLGGRTDQERAARAALSPITLDESGETD